MQRDEQRSTLKLCAAVVQVGFDKQCREEGISTSIRNCSTLVLLDQGCRHEIVGNSEGLPGAGLHQSVVKVSSSIFFTAENTQNRL